MNVEYKGVTGYKLLFVLGTPKGIFEVQEAGLYGKLIRQSSLFFYYCSFYIILTVYVATDWKNRLALA